MKYVKILCVQKSKRMDWSVVVVADIAVSVLESLEIKQSLLASVIGSAYSLLCRKSFLESSRILDMMTVWPQKTACLSIS